MLTGSPFSLPTESKVLLGKLSASISGSISLLVLVDGWLTTLDVYLCGNEGSTIGPAHDRLLWRQSQRYY